MGVVSGGEANAHHTMSLSTSTSSGVGSAKLDLLRSITARVTLLVAPAGYGKTTVANALRSDYEHAGVCDCYGIETVKGFVRAMLVALAQENPDEEAFFSGLQMRLLSAQTDGDATELVDTAWRKKPPDRSLFVFENTESIAADSALASLLTRLVDTAPLQRRIAICSRVSLPTRASRYLPPHQIATVTAADLTLSEAEAHALLEREGIADADAREKIVQVARGWAIVLLLLARLHNEGRLESALSEAESITFDDFFAFFLNEVLEVVDPGVKELMTICAAIPGVSAQELCVASGRSEFAVQSLIRKAGLIQPEGNGYGVHPLIRDVLLHNDPQWRTLVRPIAEFCEKRGDVYRAVRLYRLCADDDNAARVLAALPMGQLQSAQAASELLALPVAAIRKWPRLVAAFSFYSSEVTHDDLLELLRTAFESLSEQTDAETVAAVGAIYCLRQSDIDKAKAREIFSANLLQRASETSRSARALLAGVQQHLAEIILDVPVSEREAEYHIAAAADLSNQATWLAKKVEAYHLDAGHREEALRWAEITLGHARRAGAAFYAGGLLTAIFDAWFWGNDESAARYYDELLAVATTDPSFTYLLRALDPKTIDSALPLRQPPADPTCYLIAASKAEGAERRRILYALETLALDWPPYGRAYPLLASAACEEEPSTRKAICDRVASFVDGKLPELHAAVLAYRDGRPSFIDAFMARFEPRNKEAAAAPAAEMSIEVLRECVVLDGNALKLTPREAALLAFLSANRSGVSREEIQDAIWPDLDEQRARDSLYSLLHRLRKRLQKHDLVEGIGNGYRIAQGVQVDLWDLEFISQKSQRDGAGTSLEPVHRYYDMVQRRKYPHLMKFEWFYSMNFRVIECGRTLARTLIADALARQDHTTAIRLATELIDEDACDEWAHQVIVKAWIDTNERQKAVEAYANYCRLLKREIGAAPSREMQELSRDFNVA
jgi:DNA-binding SARP family transcriptional activator